MLFNAAIGRGYLHGCPRSINAQSNPNLSKAIDFTTIFVIDHREKPTSFVEINPAIDLLRESLRRYADDQVRERALGLGVFSDCLAIGAVYGISATGTRVCFYTLYRDTRAVESAANYGTQISN